MKTCKLVKYNYLCKKNIFDRATNVVMASKKNVLINSCSRVDSKFRTPRTDKILINICRIRSLMKKIRIGINKH